MTPTRIYTVTDGERYASEQTPSEPITDYAARRGE